jgi:hypothetical protein
MAGRPAMAMQHPAKCSCNAPITVPHRAHWTNKGRQVGNLLVVQLMQGVPHSVLPGSSTPMEA